MGVMSSTASDALKLVRDLLTHLREEAKTHVLVSAEDALYFRKMAKPPAAAKKTTEPIVLPVIELPPPPKPVVIVEVPAPPELTPLKVPSPPKPVLAEPPIVERVSFEDVRKIVAKIAPELPILDDIPNDAIAKKIAQRWKTKNQTAPISILLLNEPSHQKTLLEQMAKALDVYYGPARVINAESIEKEKQWETFLSVPELKLIIACDSTLWQLTHLMSFYKENPAQGTRYLGSIPIFLLPDLSLYLKDPLLKRSFWKALFQNISS